jgi:integrase
MPSFQQHSQVRVSKDVMIVGKSDDRQERRYSNGEINRELTTLKRILNLARQNGNLMHVPHVPMLKERNVRTGFFEREQIERTLAHLPAAIRPAVQFAYITGWRIPGEILKLQWRHVDFEARVVRLDPHTTKNDESRTFSFTRHSLSAAIVFIGRKWRNGWSGNAMNPRA